MGIRETKKERKRERSCNLMKTKSKDKVFGNYIIKKQLVCLTLSQCAVCVVVVSLRVACRYLLCRLPREQRMLCACFRLLDSVHLTHLEK